jgi:glycosyltransferase involved in cell wall biosynthesis
MNPLSGGSRGKGMRKATAPGKPLLSVVTVVFNGESHLEQAIRSVLDQSYDNVEYILVDGGSTDGTLDIIRKYEERIDRWVSEPDDGIYDAINKGLRLSSGDLVGILNCDDWYAPDALENVARAFLSLKDKDTVIAGKWNILLEDLDMTIRAAPSLDFRVGMPICHQAMFVPGSLYRKIGDYDTAYRFGADLDLLLRLHRGKVPFLFLETAVVNYRTLGASDRRFRETGKDHTRIIWRNLPLGTFLIFKIIRMKYEALTILAKWLDGIIGRKATVRLKIAYYNAKRHYGRYWS